MLRDYAALGLTLLALTCASCTTDDNTRLTFVTVGDSDMSTEATGESTDSSTTDPSTTDPSTTDPSTTDPSTTDPSTTDPSTTDPSTTDPTGADEVNVTLMVSANQAELGDTVTLSWIASGAAICTPTAGNEAWQAQLIALPEGSVDILLDEISELSFGLECEGEGGAMAMDEQVINIVCPPPEVAEGEMVPWPQYWNANWPDAVPFQQNQGLFPNEYLSIRFNTGEIVGYGQIQTIQLTNGRRWVSISQCEGVFTAFGNTDQDPCFQLQANGQELQYSTDGSFECDLEANRTYYVNVTYVDVESPGQPTDCDIDFCSFAINAPFIIP